MVRMIAHTVHSDMSPNYPFCTQQYVTELPILHIAIWHRIDHSAYVAPDRPLCIQHRIAHSAYSTGLPTLHLAMQHRIAHSVHGDMARTTSSAHSNMIYDCGPVVPGLPGTKSVLEHPKYTSKYTSKYASKHANFKRSLGYPRAI